MKMKNVFLLIFFLILEINANFLHFQFIRSLQSQSTNSYDYSSYTATSINSNLDGQTLTSTTSDQSVVYITQSGITITSSTLQKTGGDTSDIEDSEFSGVNAAVLVNGGSVTITDGEITTAAKGGNAVCATNDGVVTISGTTITSTASSSGRGLHATYGGSITASKVTISSTGGSCATLATDRGEGTVVCTDCTLTTAGSGSPLIYSTGTISISGTTGTSSGAQMVVVEGKNTATVENSSLKCTGIGNRNNVDKCGIMLYQSMSGDADTGTSTFNAKSSTMEILSTSSVYDSAPMFFITNTEAVINLENCTFTYGSDVFLDAEGTSEWGTSGSNGGSVTLKLTNQNIEGDLEIDESSSLSVTMVNSTIKGKINNSKNSATISITLDSASKITLTGNSYISSLNNADSTGSNIIKGSYSFADYSGNEYTATGSDQSSSTTSATTTSPSTTSATTTSPSTTSTPTTSPSTTSTPTTSPSTTTPSNSTGNDTNGHWIRVNSKDYISYSILLGLFNILLLN